jgi:hypothetical protein
MLTAKQVIKNKFWIVEQNGRKVATIQTYPEGVAFVQDEKREQFVSINLLKKKYNIKFDTVAKKAKKVSAVSHEVSGYQCDHKPFNALFNVAMKLPVFTKTSKSKSFFCAGYYLIKFNFGYVQAYCPKLITLNRYEFCGPFHTKAESKEYLREMKQNA